MTERQILTEDTFGTVSTASMVRLRVVGERDTLQLLVISRWVESSGTLCMVTRNPADVELYSVVY